MKIGILTGGGDCQGMNAVVRAVVRTALMEYGYPVIGFLQGWKGLTENRYKTLEMKDVSGILPLGGTILGTSSANPGEGLSMIEKNLEENRIGGLIVIGGVDTLEAGYELFRRGIPVIGIPATMDNDVGCNDHCVGFYSAVEIVAEAVDRLHTTASSHHRVMVLEVMGGKSGWVALYGGIAGGADWIVIPEVQTQLSDIIQHLKNRRGMGKDFSIIVVAEGSNMHELPIANVAEIDQFGHIRMDKRSIGIRLGNKIEEKTGFETRVTILGHLQRGGSPSVFDRILATRLGTHSVEMLHRKKSGFMINILNNQMGYQPLEKVLQESPRMVPIEMYQIARMFY